MQKSRILTMKKGDKVLSNPYPLLIKRQLILYFHYFCQWVTTDTAVIFILLFKPFKVICAKYDVPANPSRFYFPWFDPPSYGYLSHFKIFRSFSYSKWWLSYFVKHFIMFVIILLKSTSCNNSKKFLPLLNWHIQNFSLYTA